jgi:hypothetical protein
MAAILVGEERRPVAAAALTVRDELLVQQFARLEVEDPQALRR